MKYCPKCKNTKPFDEFGVSRVMADGRNPYCLVCVRERERRYYARNAEKLRQRVSDRYHNNADARERARKYSKDYYQRNKEEILEKQRQKRGGA